MRTETTKQDIIILHGRDHELVNLISLFFKKKGITASRVEDLPAYGKSQHDKVEYYIKNCTLPVVLVNYDPLEQNTGNIRPNIADELARCQIYRKNQYVVLREVKDGIAADYQSNMQGQPTEYLLDRGTPQKVAKALSLVIQDYDKLKTKEKKKNKEAGNKPIQRVNINYPSIKNVILRGWDLWDKKMWQVYDAIPIKKTLARIHCADLIDEFIWENYKVIFALYSGYELTNDEVEVIKNRSNDNYNFKVKNVLSLNEIDKICSQGYARIQEALLKIIKEVILSQQSYLEDLTEKDEAWKVELNSFINQADKIKNSFRPKDRIEPYFNLILTFKNKIDPSAK